MDLELDEMDEWDSGSANGTSPTSPTFPESESGGLKLYYMYGAAAGGVVLLFTLFIIVVLIVRCIKRSRGKYSFKSKKGSKNCDEYDDITDRAIIELFKVLDKRNGSTLEKSPQTVETTFNGLPNHTIFDSTTLSNSQPESPISINESTSSPLERSDRMTGAMVTPSIKLDASILKPLGTEPTLSAESVYDKLDEEEAEERDHSNEKRRHEDLKMPYSESLYDDTISPRLSPRHTCEPPAVTDHTYDDTCRALGTPKDHLAPITERAYAVPMLTPKDMGIDEGGDYVLPDNFPSSSNYSYASTHKLMLSPKTVPNASFGEVRSQDPITKKRASSIYTNVDDLDSGLDYSDIKDVMPPKTGHNPMYSNIDDVKNETDEYVYAQEHMLVSPTRKNADTGEVAVKPLGHHEYDPIVARSKSNSLPSNAQRSQHIYVNLRSTQTVKVSSSSGTAAPDQRGHHHPPPPPLDQETVNPIYAGSEILSALDIETSNPLYSGFEELRDEVQQRQRKEKNSSAASTSHQGDYFLNKNDWLSHSTRNNSSVGGSLSQQVEPTLNNETNSDHTYMGILVRERVSHDYSFPKPMVTYNSFSDQSKERGSGLRIQRTYSLDNSSHRYENQAMWLPKGAHKPARSKANTFSRQDSAGYMGLVGTGYETTYTLPNSFSHNSQL